MRRKEIKEHLDWLHVQDKQGMLTKDDQIDLWFKQMMFDLTKDIEDTSETPLAKEIDYSLSLREQPAATGGLTPRADWTLNTIRYTPATLDNTNGHWNNTFAPAPEPARTRQIADLSRDVYVRELQEGVYDGLNHVVIDEWTAGRGERWLRIEYDPI